MNTDIHPDRCTLCGCEAEEESLVREEDGRFFCRPCHARFIASKYMGQQVDKAVFEDVDESEETAFGDEEVVEEEWTEESSVSTTGDAGDRGGGGESFPVELSEQSGRACRACRAWLDDGVDECPHCGYSFIEAEEKANSPAGYGVAGASAFNVEELERVRLRALRKKWKHQRKLVYLLIFCGIALSYTFFYFYYALDSVPSRREVMIQYGIEFVLSLIIGVIALKKCTDVWLGKASALDRTALRLAAVLAVGDLVRLTGEAYLMPFSGWFVMIIAYIYLLGQFFNLAWAQAVILAFVALLVKIMGFSLSIILLAVEQKIEAAISIYWK